MCVRHRGSRRRRRRARQCYISQRLRCFIYVSGSFIGLMSLFCFSWSEIIVVATVLVIIVSLTTLLASMFVPVVLYPLRYPIVYSWRFLSRSPILEDTSTGPLSVENGKWNLIICVSCQVFLRELKIAYCHL